MEIEFQFNLNPGNIKETRERASEQAKAASGREGVKFRLKIAGYALDARLAAARRETMRERGGCCLNQPYFSSIAAAARANRRAFLREKIAKGRKIMSAVGEKEQPRGGKSKFLAAG